jgi:hypothetical protein
MLKEFLKQNREALLQEWFDLTVNSYEPEMARFLKAEKNQFSNPVRNTILTSFEKIYDQLLSGNGFTDSAGLEDIIKVRAVQDFSPSDALSFLFDLKRIIRLKMAAIEDRSNLIGELYLFEDEFDRLLKQAFNIYNDCRTKIQEIKISEIKSRSDRAFEIMKKQ